MEFLAGQSKERIEQRVVNGKGAHRIKNSKGRIESAISKKARASEEQARTNEKVEEAQNLVSTISGGSSISPPSPTPPCSTPCLIPSSAP